MAEQSQFSRLPKKQLVLICEQLIGRDFSTSPYDSYEFDISLETLADVVQYFSLVATDEDVEFFAKFIENNNGVLSKIFETKDKSLYEQLVIPVAKKYKVEYSQWGTCTYIEYLETTWNSYDRNWVTESMRNARDNANWDLYDGKALDTTYDNYEMDDFEFDEITEMDDIKESRIKNKIIESLDKKTLLELRGLIDNRLKTL
jgi:hypothetical protein